MRHTSNSEKRKKGRSKLTMPSTVLSGPQQAKVGVTGKIKGIERKYLIPKEFGI